MKRNNDFIPNAFDPLTRKTTWESPSIALVKYWEKRTAAAFQPFHQFYPLTLQDNNRSGFSPKEKEGDGFFI